MKKIFTKFLLFSFAFVLFGFSQLQAQTLNKLIIEAPASIAGTYDLGPADFGGQSTFDFTGQAVLIDDGVGTTSDGCEPGASNILQKVAFIDRGGTPDPCQFGTKALNAQNAGASFVIICNNVTDAMPSPLNPGDDGATVGIQVGWLTLADCDRIKMELENGEIDVRMSYQCDVPIYGPEVIWGNVSGQGDFAGGLNDWTVESPMTATEDTWFWSSTGEPIYFWQTIENQGAITSSTVCNGAAVMDSGYLAQGPEGGVPGCPAVCTASLVSPTIDLSGADTDKSIIIEFEQKYMSWQSTFNLLLSRDDGNTWPETIELNTDAILNGPAIENLVRIPIEGYAGVSNFKFKFEYGGNYYNWVIDDVRILNIDPYVDVQLNTAWYAAPRQWKSPQGQFPKQIFQADMYNNGNLDATNILGTVQVFDNTGTEIYKQESNFNNLVIPGLTLAENEVTTWPELMDMPDLAVGTYTGTYSLTATGSNGEVDTDPTNNSIDFSFKVTEDTYSITPDEAEVAEMGLSPYEEFFSGYRFGNADDDMGFYAPYYAASANYYVRSAKNASGDDLTFESVRFGMIKLDDVGGTVNIQVYRLPNGNGPAGNPDQVLAPDERQLVGSALLVVDQIENFSSTEFTMLDVPIFSSDFPSEQMKLEDDSEYMVSFIMRPSDGALQLDLMSFNSPDANNRNWYTYATNLLFIGSGYSDYPGTAYTTLVDGTDFESADMEPWFGNALHAEVVLREVTVSNVNDLNSDLNVSVYPNPASTAVSVSLALKNTSDVQIEIFNIEGKSVLARNYSSLQNEVIALNTSTLPSGNYTMKIITEEGFVAKNIVISK